MPGRRRGAAPHPRLGEGRMQRVCFQLQVKPDRIAEYRERHAAVWPELRAALTATGWRNYSLFLSDSGMLIGYVECDDFEASRRAMEETEANARWQAELSGFFQGLEGRRPDEGLLRLAGAFHLDSAEPRSPSAPRAREAEPRPPPRAR